MKGQRGFTLVEALVTGVVSVVLAGVILSVLYMSASQIREGSARMSLEKLYDIAAFEVGTRVQSAAAALGPAEHYPDRLGYSRLDSTNLVRLFDRNGNPVSGFRIQNGVLEVCDSDWNCKPFHTGMDTVRVASGKFALHGGRMGLEMRLQLTRSEGDHTYLLAPRGDKFNCRNSGI